MRAHVSHQSPAFIIVCDELGGLAFSLLFRWGSYLRSYRGGLRLVLLLLVFAVDTIIILGRLEFLLKGYLLQVARCRG